MAVVSRQMLKISIEVKEKVKNIRRISLSKSSQSPVRKTLFLINLRL